ncbi:MAG: tryptophan-rich sensory protein [Pseudomonadota bacterium]
MSAAEWVNALSWIDRVAGAVWIALTLLMLCAARWLRDDGGRFWNSSSKPILALIIVVWLYPLYSLGFSSLWLGLLGNLVVFATAAWALRSAGTRSRRAALALAPTPLWLTAASGYIGLQLIAT